MSNRNLNYHLGPAVLESDPGPSQSPDSGGDSGQPPAHSLHPGAVLWQQVRLGLFAAYDVAYMIYHLKSAPLIWWYGWRKREAEMNDLVYRKARIWGQMIMAHFGCEVEVIGAEHLPQGGPLVVWCNHQSYYDIPLLLAFLGRPAGFVIKRELIRVPILAYWMKRIHCRVLDREDPRSASHSFGRWSKELAAGDRCLVIFPEGTRTRHPQGIIGPFRRGSLRLAESQGIPILPVSIDGTRYLANPRALAATRGGGRVVRIKIGPPRRTGGMSAPEAKRFVGSLRAAIVDNWESIRVTWPGSAPAGNGGDTADGSISGRAS